MWRERVGLYAVACSLVGAILVLAVPGLAQLPANVMLVRGTIDGAEPGAVTVKTKDGPTRIGLTEKTGYASVFAARFKEIKKGDYVGITARRGADGNWQALEVHIFPEAMRGLSEGHYPWDFPGTTMTNAVVADIVRRVDGPLLTLTPKGQSVQIAVPPTAAIVRVELQQVGALRLGAGTVVVVRKETDGSLTALRLYVGQGGVMPPF
ncbi:MAG: hypothetical protein HY215_00500 [Candidatus Rokubacteria bacterium]|nr:hypothetical protein [Candidatus Rokubacteria bacterium]